MVVGSIDRDEGGVSMQGRSVPPGGQRKICIVPRLPFERRGILEILSKTFKTSSKKRSSGQGLRWLDAAVVGWSGFEGQSKERLQLT